MDSRNTSVTAQPVARPFWGLWGGLSAHVSRRVDVQCHTTVLTLPDPLLSNRKMSFTRFRPRRTWIQTFPVGRMGTRNTCVHSVLWMPASCLPPRSSHAPCLSRDSLPFTVLSFLTRPAHAAVFLRWQGVGPPIHRYSPKAKHHA